MKNCNLRLASLSFLTLLILDVVRTAKSSENSVSHFSRIKCLKSNDACCNSVLEFVFVAWDGLSEVLGEF